jgi:hypothetical protein
MKSIITLLAGLLLLSISYAFATSHNPIINNPYSYPGQYQPTCLYFPNNNVQQYYGTSPDGFQSIREYPTGTTQFNDCDMNDNTFSSETIYGE